VVLLLRQPGKGQSHQAGQVRHPWVGSLHHPPPALWERPAAAARHLAIGPAGSGCCLTAVSATVAGDGLGQ
jgi:hypothetical protein